MLKKQAKGSSGRQGCVVLLGGKGVGSGRCPDLSGPAGALLLGHGTKRHLHAPLPVSFKVLNCYTKRIEKGG
jgi:hypothetical protein